MQRFIRVTLICLATLTVCRAGELSVAPATPQAGDSLRFFYPEAASTTPPTSVLVYLFSEQSPQPRLQEVLMQAAVAGGYSGAMRIGEADVFALFRLADTDSLRELRVWDSTGQTRRGSLLRAAFSHLGNVPEQCRRPVNYQRALALLELELKRHPDNMQAAIGLAALRFELGLLTRTRYETRLAAILDAEIPQDRPNEVQAALRALRVLGRDAAAAALEEEFLRQAPASELAAELAFRQLAAQQDAEAFVTAAKRFLRQFPQSRFEARVQTAIVNTMLQQGRYAGAEEFLGSLPRPMPLAFNLIAIALGNSAGRSQDALRVARRAVSAALAFDGSSHPPYLSRAERADEEARVLGICLSTYGIALADKGDVAGALTALEDALRNLGSHAEAIHFVQLADAYAAAKRPEDAYRTAGSGLLRQPDNDSLLARHEQLYAALDSSDRPYAEILADLQGQAHEARRQDLLRRRLNLAAPAWRLEDLQGRPVSGESLIGSVVVLEFWSSWCGPCRRSLSYLDSLQRQFARRSDLRILAVNCWERDGDRPTQIRAFSSEQHLATPVALDGEDTVVRELGVTGLPTRIFIDRHGRIQFRQIGVAGETAGQDSAADIIELLLDDTFDSN